MICNGVGSPNGWPQCDLAVAVSATRDCEVSGLDPCRDLKHHQLILLTDHAYRLS